MSDTKTISWRERMASPLTWHAAGAGVLLIVLVVLATRLAWIGRPSAPVPPTPFQENRWN